MNPKLSRRSLLAGALGATQLALLDRFTRSSARACVRDDGPSRLLVLYLPGGVRFYPLFVPMRDEDVATTMPPTQSPGSEPIFCGPEDLVSFSGDSGGFSPLRMSRNWNPADPGDREGYRHSPMGYSWLHYELGATTAALHGIDQGSFAHAAAYVSAMCGVAGEAYRAPALVSVVADFLHRRFADTRPIPCVAINTRGLPQSMGLPAHAAPAVVPSLDSLAGLFSADGERHRRWRNADARTETEVVGLDGATQRLGVTNVDRLLLERTRALGRRARGGNREVLEQIWGSYAAVSRTLASDVVGAVQAITATTQEKPDHLRAYGMYDMTFGLANGRVDMNASCEWILRLLKSDVTSVVYANLPERYYDYHDGSSVGEATAATRAQLDIVARMLGEMKATPSPDRPGRTLYDDTVVVIQSEFNRTWPRGVSREAPDSWTYGDDHNAVTSVLVSGGRVAGNRQIGGFELPSTEGLPVTIAEESGETSTRRPRAADFVATICDLFGMRMGEDFFIPGGYGVIRGLCE